jgi:hypothetical protein
LPLLLLLGGCKKESSISGTVTFDGVPVEKGFITFFPVDDAGATRGSDIIVGQYQVKGLTPGKRKVRISALPQGEIVASEPGAPRTIQWSTPLAPIPTNAVGNNQIIEITKGPQQQDFHLQSP